MTFISNYGRCHSNRVKTVGKRANIRSINNRITASEAQSPIMYESHKITINCICAPIAIKPFAIDCQISTVCAVGIP